MLKVLDVTAGAVREALSSKTSRRPFAVSMPLYLEDRKVDDLMSSRLSAVPKQNPTTHLPDSWSEIEDYIAYDLPKLRAVAVSYARDSDVVASELARERLETEVATQTTNSGLQTKIRQIIDALRSTRTLFSKIQTAIHDHANSEHCKRKEEISSLSGEWDTIFTEFDRCMIGAHVMAKDFTETILPVLLRDTSMEVKQDTIDGHIKALEELSKEEAEQLHLNFSTLQRLIEGFSGRWGVYCETLSSTLKNIFKRMRKSQIDKLKDINKKLRKARAMTAILIAALFGAGALTAGVAIAVVLAPLNMGISAILTSPESAIPPCVEVTRTFWEKLRSSQKEVEKLRIERDKQIAEVNQLPRGIFSAKDVERSIVHQELDFASIILEVSLLSDVWGLIVSDLTAIKQHFRVVKYSTAELLQKRVDELSVVYNSLGDALRQYAQGLQGYETSGPAS